MENFKSDPIILNKVVQNRPVNLRSRLLIMYSGRPKIFTTFAKNFLATRSAEQVHGTTVNTAYLPL